MLGDVPLAARGVSFTDLVAGSKYHRILLPGAHQHPYLLQGSTFEGLSTTADSVNGSIVGVDFNSLVVRSDRRASLRNIANNLLEQISRKTGKDGKQNWSNLKEAQNYTHPPDIQLFSDAPIFSLLGEVQSRRIADLGSGNGIISLVLASQRAFVDGVDVSAAMLRVASERALQQDLLVSTSFGPGSADNTSLASEVYDGVVCSLVINNIATVNETKGVFREANRLLKSGGKFIISLPHPLTLSYRTNNRWTEWKPGQSQHTLQPGEAFIRKILTAKGTMLEITNNFWHPDMLAEYAKETGLIPGVKVEMLANEEQIQTHSLHKLYRSVPFFLVMSFIKP